jgi:hypothetical protein
VRRHHCQAWQLARASPSMAYGHWSGVRGAKNEEETVGILTKGFTMKGHPHGELTTAVLPLQGSPYLGGFSSGRFMPMSAQAASPFHAVLYKVLTGLGKRCAVAAAMELELDYCDGEKLSWGRWEGSFIGLGVWVGKVQYLESKYQLNREFS